MSASSLRKSVLLSLTLVIIAAFAYGLFLFEAPFGPRTPILADFPPGTPTDVIANRLQQKGLIRSRIAFLALHYLEGGTLKAGEYRFSQPASLPAIYGRLRRGDVYSISVTIPEGDNIFDIANRLAAAHITTKAAFLKVAKHDTALIHGLDPKDPTLEGYLFPDTYKFTPGVSAKQVASTMVARFRLAARQLGLLPAPNSSAKSLKSTQNPSSSGSKTASKTSAQTQNHAAGAKNPQPFSPSLHEIVTIASLIERETPIPSERPLVASVFYNRLRKHMPLMTDPSVIYAAILQHKYRGVIYESDLKSNSPYNTYTHLGLPPGPICNPGLGALQAAMHPAKTNYLYFVAASANPSGRSLFSSTLAQHDKNVAAYRRAVWKARHHH